MSTFVERFSSVEDIIEAYEAPSDALAGATVLLAWYGYGDYCGQSLVIFEKNGILYEVNGGHCSCYGLEGQWEPEETLWEALAMRNYSAYEGGDEVTSLLRDLVEKHSKESQ